jgi:hypothetical protein
LPFNGNPIALIGFGEILGPLRIKRALNRCWSVVQDDCDIALRIGAPYHFDLTKHLEPFPDIAFDEEARAAYAAATAQRGLIPSAK